jgi:hypothetical protein
MPRSRVGDSLACWCSRAHGIWASGLTPVFRTGLLALGGGEPWWAAGYLAAAAVISLVAVVVMPRWIGRRAGWAREVRW